MEDIPGMRVAVKKSLLMLGQEHIERECIDEATGQPGLGLGLAGKRPVPIICETTFLVRFV